MTFFFIFWKSWWKFLEVNDPPSKAFICIFLDRELLVLKKNEKIFLEIRKLCSFVSFLFFRCEFYGILFRKCKSKVELNPAKTSPRLFSLENWVSFENCKRFIFFLGGGGWGSGYCFMIKKLIFHVFGSAHSFFWFYLAFCFPISSSFHFLFLLDFAYNEFLRFHFLYLFWFFFFYLKFHLSKTIAIIPFTLHAIFLLDVRDVALEEISSFERWIFIVEIYIYIFSESMPDCAVVGSPAITKASMAS